MRQLDVPPLGKMTPAGPRWGQIGIDHREIRTSVEGVVNSLAAASALAPLLVVRLLFLFLLLTLRSVSTCLSPWLLHAQ
jgi:hypothetical protein